jgi:hypothetical protein
VERMPRNATQCNMFDVEDVESFRITVLFSSSLYYNGFCIRNKSNFSSTQSDGASPFFHFITIPTSLLGSMTWRQSLISIEIEGNG